MSRIARMSNGNIGRQMSMSTVLMPNDQQPYFVRGAHLFDENLLAEDLSALESQGLVMWTRGLFVINLYKPIPIIPWREWTVSITAEGWKRQENESDSLVERAKRQQPGQILALVWTVISTTIAWVFQDRVFSFFRWIVSRH